MPECEGALWQRFKKKNHDCLFEKHLQHQRDLFHNYIDFKKAFDRVWHAGLWLVPKSFNVEEGLVQAIQALYENSNSAVLLNSQHGGFIQTTAGVRQGCLPSPFLFNLFTEKIMEETVITTHPFPKVAGQCTTYDSPTSSI